MRGRGKQLRLDGAAATTDLKGNVQLNDALLVVALLSRKVVPLLARLALLDGRCAALEHRLDFRKVMSRAKKRLAGGDQGRGCADLLNIVQRNLAVCDQLVANGALRDEERNEEKGSRRGTGRWRGALNRR